MNQSDCRRYAQYLRNRSRDVGPGLADEPHDVAARILERFGVQLTTKQATAVTAVYDQLQAASGYTTRDPQ